MLDQIDALIEHRRAELRALEVAREALAGWGGVSVSAEAPARQLPPAPPAAVDRQERRDRIRAAAGAPLAAAPAPVPGKRRRHTAAFKLQVLRELDGGRSHREVLAEHQLSASVISYWRKQAASGALAARAQNDLEDAAAEGDGPIAGLDNDVVVTAGDEDEGDLVDAMSGGEAVEDDALPFGEEDGMPSGLAGAAPPRPRGRPRMFG